jgi:hypothetical protein
MIPAAILPEMAPPALFAFATALYTFAKPFCPSGQHCGRMYYTAAQNWQYTNEKGPAFGQTLFHAYALF